MSLFGFKGGIGTASRRVDTGVGVFTVGVLVLANFGSRPLLTIAGVPVGQRLARAAMPEPPESGSVMVIVATDAPLIDRGLGRLARRAPLGLARLGSVGGHGSGDYVLAFSTAHRIPHDSQVLLEVRLVPETSNAIDPLFQATVEATEEACVNALFRATTIVGRDGHRRDALPLDHVLPLLRTAGVLAGF
jgi:D-aminopeptidase